MENRPILKKVPDPSNPEQTVLGTVVKITGSEEPFSHAYLEDGTTITSKLSFIEAVRIDGQWDKNGNPVYHITQNGALIVSSPENLMKKDDDDAH